MLLGLVVLGVAVLVVLGTSIVKQVNWSARIKHTVAAVLAVLGGAVTVFANNGWSFDNFATSDTLGIIALVYASSQAIYQWFIKNTATDARLESVGQRTE